MFLHELIFATNRKRRTENGNIKYLVANYVWANVALLEHTDVCYLGIYETWYKF